MDDIQRMVAEHACARLCIAFHAYIDKYDHAKIPALFVEDPDWDHRTRGKIASHADIASYLDSKSTYPVVKHVVTNVLIDVIDEDNAKGQAYVTFYYSEPNADLPVLEAPLVLVTYQDTFRRTASGWRFVSRKPTRTHQAPSHTRLINTKDDETRLRRR